MFKCANDLAHLQNKPDEMPVYGHLKAKSKPHQYILEPQLTMQPRWLGDHSSQ